MKKGVAGWMACLVVLNSCGMVDQFSEQMTTWATEYLAKKVQLGIKIPPQAVAGVNRAPQAEEKLEFLNIVKILTLPQQQRHQAIQKFFSYMGTPHLPAGGGCRIGRMEKDGNKYTFDLEYCALGILMYYASAQGFISGLFSKKVGIEDIENPNLFVLAKVSHVGVEVQLNDQYEIQWINLDYNRPRSHILSVMLSCDSPESQHLCQPADISTHAIKWATEKLSDDMVQDFGTWSSKTKIEFIATSFVVLLVSAGLLVDDTVSVQLNRVVASKKALDVTRMELELGVVDQKIINELRQGYQQLNNALGSFTDRVSLDQLRSTVQRYTSGLTAVAGKIDDRKNSKAAEAKRKLLAAIRGITNLPLKNAADLKEDYLEKVSDFYGVLGELGSETVTSTLKDEIYYGLNLYRNVINGYLQTAIHSSLVSLKTLEHAAAEAEKSLTYALQEGMFQVFLGLDHILQPLEESTVFYPDDVVVQRTPRGDFVRKNPFEWAKGALTDADLARDPFKVNDGVGAVNAASDLTKLRSAYGTLIGALSNLDAPTGMNRARQFIQKNHQQVLPLLAYFIRSGTGPNRFTGVGGRENTILALEILLAHTGINLSDYVQALFMDIEASDAVSQRMMDLSLRYLILVKGQQAALQALSLKTRRPTSLDQCRVYRPLFYHFPADSVTDRTMLSFNLFEQMCMTLIP